MSKFEKHKKPADTHNDHPWEERETKAVPHQTKEQEQHFAQEVEEIDQTLNDLKTAHS